MGRFLEPLQQVKCHRDTDTEVTHMAYDEKLAERVRAIFQTEPTYSEKKMFGGVCFMVGRNKAVGVTGTDLMVRPGPENFEAALAPFRGQVELAVDGGASSLGQASTVVRCLTPVQWTLPAGP